MKALLVPVVAILDPILEAHGFLRGRAGQIYRRKGQYVWMMLQLQTSSATRDSCVIFTVNVGLASVLLAKRLGSSLRNIGSAQDCHLFYRATNLVSEDSDDRWWTVTSEREARIAAQDVLALVQRVLATVGSVESDAAFCRFLREHANLPDWQTADYLRQLEC
jgi:hypothetical protein